MVTRPWLLLTYKVPPEPASKRIALWRRLKGMGAVYLQNGVCLVPRTDDHARRLKMLENDVAEMGGEAVILETIALDRAQEEKVVARFKADRDDAYRELIDKCDDFEGEIAKETAAAALHLQRTRRERRRAEEAQGLVREDQKARFLRGRTGGGSRGTAERLREAARRLRAAGIRST